MKFHRWDIRDVRRDFCLEHRCYHEHLIVTQAVRQQIDQERERLFADHEALYHLGQHHRSQAALGYPKHDALERDANQRSEAIWRQLVAL